MKYLRNVFLGLLVMILPVLAFGANSTQKKSLRIDQKAVVDGQQLKPGSYTLKWNDNSNNTNVAFQLDGKTVATAPAQVVHQPNPDNANYEINNASGQPQLRRVYLSKEQLVFGGGSQAGANGSQSTPPTQ